MFPVGDEVTELGYVHMFTDMFEAIDAGTEPRETFYDGYVVNAVMDAVNQRYGELALAPARLLNRSSMPNVIAPAWKPYGHRQTL